MVLVSNMGSKPPRGYFGIGVEGVSKPMNFGNLARSAHGSVSYTHLTLPTIYSV